MEGYIWLAIKILDRSSVNLSCPTHHTWPFVLYLIFAEWVLMLLEVPLADYEAESQSGVPTGIIPHVY